MDLIYILTHDCNFRCKYCDINKKNENISIKTLQQSYNFIKNSNLTFDKIKFFGGEPLLEKIKIENIVQNINKISTPKYFITTNTTLIDEKFMTFSEKNNIKITFSIDGDENSENRVLINGKNISEEIIQKTKKYSYKIRVNQVISSKNSKYFFNNFKFIYDLGVRQFNFLPEYYKEWTKKGLKNLQDGFEQILDFKNRGNNFHLVNLENYSEVSFFNLGIVIDTDGKLYGTNLVMLGIFEKYKDMLSIGSLDDGLLYNLEDKNFIKDYTNKINQIIQTEYSPSVLKSVKYVDIILNNFCNKYSK